MAEASRIGHSEGLGVARFFMVLSSISPLFILWAIRGSKLIPDTYLIASWGLLVAIPYAFLWLRIRVAHKEHDRRELTVGRADDHRDHLLVYLFAILLPLFSVDLDSARNLGAALFALLFIVFLFWHLDLHYMNLLFAVRGYRVYTIYPPRDSNPLTGKGSNILITRRTALSPGDRVTAYRLSDTVYLES